MQGWYLIFIPLIFAHPFNLKYSKRRSKFFFHSSSLPSQVFIVYIRYQSLIKNQHVCVTEQHFVSIFFTHLWSLRKPMLLQYKGSLVTNQQKYPFSAVFASFLLAVWFCIYTHAQLRIVNVYQKAEVCAQIINE